MYKPGKIHLTMFRVRQDRAKNVDWKTGVELGRKISVSERLPVEYIDVSTRFEYDITKFYTPMVRIDIPTKKQEPTLEK